MRTIDNIKSIFLYLKEYIEEIFYPYMSTDTLKKFDRIVAILIQLQSKRYIKVHELADRFEVSKRTVYRDIRTLENSGVPILNHPGKGYSLVEGYRLPPVMFTRKEAGSFVAAEKLMKNFMDKTMGAYFESAMFKIKSVLKGSEKDLIDILESQVYVSSEQVNINDTIPDVLEILFDSIGGRQQALLKYRSLATDQPTKRYIEPVGVFQKNRYWYIYAYCHLRKDYRQFRTDRIQAIERTEYHFFLKHKSLDEYLSREEQGEAKSTTKVRIIVKKEVLPFIRSGMKNHGLVSQEDRGTEVELCFLTTGLQDGFPRWYLMFGDYARIIEPEELKDRIREITGKIQSGI